MWTLLLLVCTPATLVGCAPTSESFEIHLKDGPVRGYLTSSYDSKSFVAFEGIPYAKPPINGLRFAEPQKPTAWTKALDANATYICPQFLPIQVLGSGTVGEEDCLYINVYVPGHNLTPSPPRRVVVHIHGGAFILGAPKMMAGSRYVMNEDVVYVSFNYRLGVFGFLSTADDAAAGNWGLKDQNLALKWIQDNIESFGGDKRSITLTGHSAGSASVHYHLLSGQSARLFHRAVMLSGSALNPWALTESPLAKAHKLAGIFECTIEDTHELVECLRGVNAKDLALAMKKFTKFRNILPVVPFGPVVEHAHDRAFITQSPYKLLEKGEIANDVPLIMSFVKDEGIFPSGFFASLGSVETIRDEWYDIMQYGLDLQDTVAEDDWSVTLKRIKEFYFPEDDLSTKNLDNLTLLWSDRFYFLGIEHAIRQHVRRSRHPVHVYRFLYDSPGFNVFPGVKGVAHAEDLQLMFNLMSPISRRTLAPSDVAMSHFLTKMLRDFAHNTLTEGWTPMSKESKDVQFYEIRAPEGNKMAALGELAPTAFWDSLPIRERY